MITQSQTQTQSKTNTDTHKEKQKKSERYTKNYHHQKKAKNNILNTKTQKTYINTNNTNKKNQNTLKITHNIKSKHTQIYNTQTLINTQKCMLTHMHACKFTHIY